MNLSQTITMQIEKNGRTYLFIIPAGAPYGECYDTGFEFLNKIIELTQESLKKAAAESQENV